jgi:hypothetical protein
LKYSSSIPSTYEQKKHEDFQETLKVFRAEGLSSSVTETVMTLMTFLKLGQLPQEDIASDSVQAAYLYEAHLIETAKAERLILLKLWNAVKERRQQNPLYDMNKAQVHLLNFIPTDIQTVLGKELDSLNLQVPSFRKTLV